MVYYHYWYIYLCYDKIYFNSTSYFPKEHLAKYGRVKLFDHYVSTHHGGVVVKPRNIYFIPIKITLTQIQYLITILRQQNWVKNSLCDIDINNYPEIFI